MVSLLLNTAIVIEVYNVNIDECQSCTMSSLKKDELIVRLRYSDVTETVTYNLQSIYAVWFFGGQTVQQIPSGRSRFSNGEICNLRYCS